MRDYKGSEICSFAKKLNTAADNYLFALIYQSPWCKYSINQQQSKNSKISILFFAGNRMIKNTNGAVYKINCLLKENDCSQLFGTRQCCIILTSGTKV